MVLENEEYLAEDKDDSKDGLSHEDLPLTRPLHFLRELEKPESIQDHTSHAKH